MKKQLLLFVVMLLPIVASAYDIAAQNADGVTIYYNYINNGTELAVTYRGDNANSYNEYTGNVIIPEEVSFMNRTRKVTSIDNSAFAFSSALTSVTIPNTVTSIDYSAFDCCYSLTSVTIPNSVTSIGSFAFNSCYSLTSVTIPNSVTQIERFAFQFCSALTSITIGNSVTSIGKNAFESCSALTSITIPNSVTSIDYGAFEYCSGLTSITIPNSVISIGDNAFAYCSGLTSITIPNSVISIGDYAFYKCSGLTSVTIGSAVTNIGTGSFDKADIPTIISLIENPNTIKGKALNSRIFSLNTFNNATLYVPKGTIDKYKATDGWKDFVFIEEGDINGIANVPAKALMIKNNGGQLTIEGAADDEAISVYTVNGVQSGSAISQNGAASINTNLQAGSIAIVKIGDKSFKVVIK